MEPVLLRGVNRSGLEYVEPGDLGFLSAGQFTSSEIQHICESWNCNVLRLPFNQSRALRGNADYGAEDYLGAIDQIVEWAASFGAYTILDLQWLDTRTVYGFTRSGTGAAVPNHVPPLPNPETVLLWRTLAERYSAESAILFDLFNEPHSRLADDATPLHVIAQDGSIVESDTYPVAATDWLAWAKLLISTIRDPRPDGVLLVGGVDWGFDLHDIQLEAPNLVYSAHIYPSRKPSIWWKAIGRAGEVPVFVGEWGGTEKDLTFARKLAGVMRSEGLGWTAWSWADHPHLLKSPRSADFTPSTFGQFVRNELRNA